MSYNTAGLQAAVILLQADGTCALTNLANHSHLAEAVATKQPKLFIDKKDHPQPHYRFRYATEGQSGAILTSLNSSNGNRRNPTVTVLNYTGWIRIRCSCVTADGPPYRPHPFRLTGQNCEGGVFETDKQITDSDRQVQLRHVGINCVKLRELRDAASLSDCLRERRARSINPFNTRWDDFDVRQDGHSVRLCFEAIPINGLGGAPLRDVASAQPIVTSVIHGKLTSDDLKIFRLSRTSAPATGQCELIVLCSKVQAHDLHVRFFDEATQWECDVELRASDVHKQYAIVTRVPRYRDVTITHSVPIRIQLIRPSTGERSRDVNFQYEPIRDVASADNAVVSVTRQATLLSEDTPSDDEPTVVFDQDDVSASVSTASGTHIPPPPAAAATADVSMKRKISENLKHRLKRRKSALSNEDASEEDASETPSNGDFRTFSRQASVTHDAASLNQIAQPLTAALSGVTMLIPGGGNAPRYAYLVPPTSHPWVFGATGDQTSVPLPFSYPFIMMPAGAAIASQRSNFTMASSDQYETHSASNADVVLKNSRHASVSSHDEKMSK